VEFEFGQAARRKRKNREEMSGKRGRGRED
jgi:hypothetical protein